MSDVTLARIAVLQHKRQQEAFREALSKISDGLGELPHDSLGADASAQLQNKLYVKLKDMRARGVLQRRVFADAEGAVKAVLEHVGDVGSDEVFEVYGGARGSGFFVGLVSPEFLRACLRSGYEGFAAVVQVWMPGLFLISCTTTQFEAISTRWNGGKVARTFVTRYAR